MILGQCRTCVVGVILADSPGPRSGENRTRSAKPNRSALRSIPPNPRITLFACRILLNSAKLPGLGRVE